jgi:hypothetical protein
VRTPERCDLLDLERAEVVRFPDGRIMRVARYEFRRDRRPASPLFRIVGLESRCCFIHEDLRVVIARESLSGLRWQPIGVLET